MTHMHTGTQGQAGSQIKGFNTGRMYTSSGQRIAYKVLECKPEEDFPGSDGFSAEYSDYKLAFVDIDRGINGELSVYFAEGIDEVNVMRAYDAGHYDSCIADMKLLGELEAFAHTIG